PSTIPPPPSPALFPYTTLFRSDAPHQRSRAFEQRLGILQRIESPSTVVRLQRTEDHLVIAIGTFGQFTNLVGTHQGRTVVSNRLLHEGYILRSSSTRSTRSPAETRALVTFSSKRSEEHTSELQSRENLVCRLLLEKKKKE